MRNALPTGRSRSCDANTPATAMNKIPAKKSFGLLMKLGRRSMRRSPPPFAACFLLFQRSTRPTASPLAGPGVEHTISVGVDAGQAGKSAKTGARPRNLAIIARPPAAGPRSNPLRANLLGTAGREIGLQSRSKSQIGLANFWLRRDPGAWSLGEEAPLRNNIGIIAQRQGKMHVLL